MSNKPFNTPGPRPGSDKAISQRKAINEGYEAAPSKRCVKLGFGEPKSSGRNHVPGLSNREGRRAR